MTHNNTIVHIAASEGDLMKVKSILSTDIYASLFLNEFDKLPEECSSSVAIKDELIAARKRATSALLTKVQDLEAVVEKTEASLAAVTKAKEKADYRIMHLLRGMDSGAAPSPSPSTTNTSKGAARIPMGHTTFTWTGSMDPLGSFGFPKKVTTAAPASAPASKAVAPSLPSTKESGPKPEGKKEPKPKKEKEAAPAAPAAAEIGVGSCEFRVGKITKIWKHPESTSLYCEEIDLGEGGGPRQIASGLQEYIPIEKLENRLVVVIVNLLPRPLAGFNSNGMVMCANLGSEGKKVVEVIDPPSGAKVGELITFDGYASAPLDGKAMKKKKILETVFPDLKSVKTESGTIIAAYKGIPFNTSAGPCTVKSLVGASLS